jgi:hypothetical protein
LTSALVGGEWSTSRPGRRENVLGSGGNIARMANRVYDWLMTA